MVSACIQTAVLLQLPNPHVQGLETKPLVVPASRIHRLWLKLGGLGENEGKWLRPAQPRIPEWSVPYSENVFCDVLEFIPDCLDIPETSLALDSGERPRGQESGSQGVSAWCPPTWRVLNPFFGICGP